MSATNPTDLTAVLAQLRAQAGVRAVDLSEHAARKLPEVGVTYGDLLAVIAVGVVLENYPTYYKGPCCLLCGNTPTGRPIHIVCSTTTPTVIIITVYEPTLPKWLTPIQRREKVRDGEMSQSGLPG